MYPLLLLSAVLINFVIANHQIQNHTHHATEIIINTLEKKNNNMGIPLWKQHFWTPHKPKVTKNSSYIDRAENMIRMPTMNPFEDKKKKILKKSPKRTIQKIIKKNRQKTKRIFVVKMTTATPLPVAHSQGQVDNSEWKENLTTLPANQRKKFKKSYSKLSRNPKPFQNLQKNKLHKRDKRNTFDRQDFYILKDFNEMKFLKNEKDYSVVNAHIQKYW